MIQRSKLKLAALTSAALPSVTVSGVRESEQVNATDETLSIDQAVVQDTTGKLYDVCACNTEQGKRRLSLRVKAAEALFHAKEPAGLGFDLDRVLAFESGSDNNSVTGDTAVMISVHHEGQSRPLDLLTLDDCASVGTAIGAIHRLRPTFLQENKYPVFTTGQIRTQLISWIKRLRQAGHVPAEITNSWAQILETDGLWSFGTVAVHGGFSDGDFLFSGSTITAITNWQNMQVNDPARDLAWIFAKLDESHRNALLSAYGRILGSRLDDLIMLRANLWLQMEQVGDFIQALNAADNVKIMLFKAQVERLAHQLGVSTRSANHNSQTSQYSQRPGSTQSPSTITVGTLLHESEQRRAALQNNAGRPDEAEDETGESDRTGSSQIASEQSSEADSTADRPIQSAPRHATPSNEETQAVQAFTGADRSNRHGSPSQASDDTDSREIQHGSPFSAETVAVSSISTVISDDTSDDTSDGTRNNTSDSTSDNRSDNTVQPVHKRSLDPETILIPLLEREQRAMRDAEAGLEEYETKQHHEVAQDSEYHSSQAASETLPTQGPHDE